MRLPQQCPKLSLSQGVEECETSVGHSSPVVNAIYSHSHRRRRCYIWTRLPMISTLSWCYEVKRRYSDTLFVPLCSAQIDWSMSTLSPNEYPKEGPLEMADATADLRKSMMVRSLFKYVHQLVRSHNTKSTC